MVNFNEVQQQEHQDNFHGHMSTFDDQQDQYYQANQNSIKLKQSKNVASILIVICSVLFVIVAFSFIAYLYQTYQTSSYKKSKQEVMSIQLPLDKFETELSQTQQRKGLKRAQKFINSVSVNSQISKAQLQKLSEEQFKYYDGKYNISTPNENLPKLCIFIQSFNNVELNKYQSNLFSVLSQNYPSEKYKIVYIDDASSDSTQEKVRKWVQDYAKQHKENQQPSISQPQKSEYEIKMNGKFISPNFLLVKHKQKQGQLSSLLNAAKNFCQPGQIMIPIDGQDYLIGKQVFRVIANLMLKKGAYYSYTNFLYSSLNVGNAKQFPNQVLNNKSYRQATGLDKWPVGQLTAFYTDLARNINQNDLKDENGKFIRDQSLQNFALSLYLLQMSGENVKFIDEILYYDNQNVKLNDQQLKQNQDLQLETIIRGRKKYQTVKLNL